MNGWKKILRHAQYWTKDRALKAKGFAEAVIEAYDFSDFNSICDVGGGQGAFLIQLLSQLSSYQGICSRLAGGGYVCGKSDC